MKNSLRSAAVLTLLAGAALVALPASARVLPASDLQLVAEGRRGVVMGQAGCTRVTNRFCVQSTKSNCFACR